ncbi:hypothetical protein A3L12_03575 [Thermococcus sp. P6]|uniref:transglutaminase domain-containing protein n=1 Tax=Thermococcus sp. P6 TaxID=122420 RepID=UPI000B59D33E|nr:transglutaminase domain-containing protein [Thermococcus sp. P6]ASJ10443.1 hypothetical protein A3L12_03575 [Thermococcus sp. P6]
MAMRKPTPLLLILMVMVVASGCLFRPPAEVRFSVDRTVVGPGEKVHVIVTVNNTGKVGLTGATLVLSGGDFQILQEPKFPDVLPVGETVQLVWILRAPARPGVYDLKLSLELTDELRRSWTGFYGQFRIRVSMEEIPPEGVELEVEAPDSVTGGNTTRLTVIIKNRLDVPVELRGVDLELLEGMEIVGSSALPESVEGKGEVRVSYLIKTPYAHREGYASTIVRYAVNGREYRSIKSFPMEVLWRPWERGENALKDAYGLKYHWITDGYLVDAYWMELYNSTPIFNRTELREVALKIIGNSTSEAEAARRIYNWTMERYSLGDTTSSLKVRDILPQDRISYAEGQILFTAMLRSLNVPARIITLSNGTDCTFRPMTEFYTVDGWYVVDLRHGFVGPVDEYIASPYFPRIYQLVTVEGYRIVAQAPTELKGHEHIDVTADFLSNLEDRLLRVITGRLDPGLRSKLMVVMNDLNEKERLYALFLFASAPGDDLNRVLGEYSTDRIEEYVKTLYDFYKNLTWRDDFTRYWRIFAGEV